MRLSALLLAPNSHRQPRCATGSFQTCQRQLAVQGVLTWASSAAKPAGAFAESTTTRTWSPLRQGASCSSARGTRAVSCVCHSRSRPSGVTSPAVRQSSQTEDKHELSGATLKSALPDADMLVCKGLRPAMPASSARAPAAARSHDSSSIAVDACRTSLVDTRVRAQQFAWQRRAAPRATVAT
jgi:hypothetical protein